MATPDGRYTLVYNGEIYNYRELRTELAQLGHLFHTESDTEVLLAAWTEWGAACLHRLTGMFAFAVYDRQDQTLTLVRDAFGIKPLFYGRIQGSLYFASEITALLALLPQRPGLNRQRAFDYLAHGAMDDRAETFFEGIYHLLPGHILRLSLPLEEKVVATRWWWPSIAERGDLRFDQAAEALRVLFIDSVRLHLRSDVPIGAALSGGMDSSALVCAIRHLEPEMPIHTFSFVARGHALNEEPWADLVNAHTGAVAHKVLAAPEELANDLDDLIRTQGEPFGSTSIYAQYRVFKAAREAGVVVTLDGQGADELLAGYWGYPHARLRSLLETGHWRAGVRLLTGWHHTTGRPVAEALLPLVYNVMPTWYERVKKSFFRHKGNNIWDFGTLPPPLPRDTNYTAGWWPEGKHEKGRALAHRLRTELCGQMGLAHLLRFEDRNAMRWSVESRVPFLSIPLAEFVLSLPEHFLLSHHGTTKHLFREAMRGIVPDAVLDRRDKLGFATPERQWFQQIRPQIGDLLRNTPDIPLLDADAAARYVADMLDGKRPFGWQAWRLVNFSRWYSLFF